MGNGTIAAAGIDVNAVNRQIAQIDRTIVGHSQLVDRDGSASALHHGTIACQGEISGSGRYVAVQHDIGTCQAQGIARYGRATRQRQRTALGIDRGGLAGAVFNVQEAAKTDALPGDGHVARRTCNRVVSPNVKAVHEVDGPGRAEGAVTVHRDVVVKPAPDIDVGSEAHAPRGGGDVRPNEHPIGRPDI